MFMFRTLLLKLKNISSILLLLLMLSSPASAAFARPQKAPAYRAENQLANLSPQEIVGQLFLITFNGSDTSAAAPIFDLIINYHIGGVILERENENFVNADNIPQDCWQLTRDLQLIEYDSSSLSDSKELSFGFRSREYLPLLIGLSQEGDLSLYTELITGLSPIPSQLALGATWDPEFARQIGEQVGRELSALGINLLFGPSLDVLSNPATGKSDLGVRSFGGDPYWVGKFGQAYIQGVHTGSLNSLAVVGKYFPGLGGSDRLPEEEVATVRKSLEQLIQSDLAPFFAVTGNAPAPDQAVDALLNSHIRYQGLQGNIRSTTRPISLDPQAFDLLMSLDPLANWRKSGGVIISDNLGSQALQQLYNPTGSSYDLSRVALDAFIAGNDILFLGNAGPEDKPLPNHEIEDTINVFTKKYIEDQDFAEKVDASVLRILDLKNSLYPGYQITSVLPSENSLSVIGDSNIADLVSRQSATLLNPDLTDLDAVFQNPPNIYNRLVILSNTETQSLCDACLEIPTFTTTSLEDAIIRLYGPLSSRQLGRANINSYSFKDLTTLLDYPSETIDMGADLYNANWIIVAFLGQSPERPDSGALNRLLSERQDLLRNKKIIVFAFGAPYYLDATNISKISAYFGLYTKIPSSIDVAARIIFKEVPTFPGNLPVSVPGLNYDLISATSPDPSRPFSIFVGSLPDPQNISETDGSTPAPPVYRVEEVIDLFTGKILDHNGKPVPDGTPVDFVITSQTESTHVISVVTLDGSASTSYLVQHPSNLTVHAVSSQARSNSIEISIFGDIAEFSCKQFSNCLSSVTRRDCYKCRDCPRPDRYTGVRSVSGTNSLDNLVLLSDYPGRCSQHCLLDRSQEWIRSKGHNLGHYFIYRRAFSL